MLVKFMAALASALGLLVAAIACLICYYIWPDKDSTMPAWIQAVGSVGAIVIAIVVMDTQHRRSERARLAQANAERANIMCAVCFFAVEMNGQIAILRIGIQAAKMNRLSAEAVLTGLRLAQASIADLPIWQCEIDEVREMNIINLQFRSLIAAIEMFDTADHRSRSRISANPIIKAPTFAADEMPALLDLTSDAIRVSEQFLRQRYFHLTGQSLIT
jgi:uncharacterized membrane protein